MGMASDTLPCAATANHDGAATTTVDLASAGPPTRVTITCDPRNTLADMDAQFGACVAGEARVERRLKLRNKVAAAGGGIVIVGMPVKVVAGSVRCALHDFLMRARTVLT